MTEELPILNLTGDDRNSDIPSEKCYARYQTLDFHVFQEFSKSVQPSPRKTRATGPLNKGPLTKIPAYSLATYYIDHDPKSKKNSLNFGITNISYVT